MTVMLTLMCGGCNRAEVVGPLRRRFHGSHGNSGWGAWKTDDPRLLTPDGWVMFDPYTQATYCPECWASIESPTTAQTQERTP
jgi:hypothetical protein